MPSDDMDRMLTATEWTDRELSERMLAREGKAWQEFHRRYHRLIYRCIHKVHGRFGGVVGEDDVEEVFAQFLFELTARDMKKLQAWRPERGSKLGSWVGLLATNTAWDHLRRLSRRPACFELHEGSDVGDIRDDPFQSVAHREELSMVKRSLEQFSTKDQEFVRLYFLDGLSPEAVADAMGISVKTVYSKKHKIRCRLEKAREVQLRAAA
ncbi:MAG: sigma-70 family RNA polymerase sigma factor [Alcanivorax sp.]|nr:sigma-70 family RNA polymerase sigma factor [Alcanivorax sp.]